MAIDKIQKTSLLIPPAGLDTHIQYNNNGQLAGSSSFVINSSGHIGIGTNDPKDRLHVKIGSDLNWQFGYPSSNTTSLAALNDLENAYVLARIDANPLQINSQSGGSIAIGDTTNPDGLVHIHSGSAGTVTANNTADDLVIESSGDGGLSILTPAVNNGRIYFGSPINPAYGQIDYDHSTNKMVFATAGAGRLIIDSAGRVGIGTASPLFGYDLHIVSNPTHSGVAQIGLEAGTSSVAQLSFGDSGDIDAGRVSYNNATDTMQIGTNASIAMTIDSSGNVGIGTTNPAYPFQVSQTGNGYVSMFETTSSTDGDIVRLALRSAATQGQLEFGVSNSPSIPGGANTFIQAGKSSNEPGLGIYAHGVVIANTAAATLSRNAMLQVDGELHINHSNNQEGGAIRLGTNANQSFMHSNAWYDDNLLRVFYNQNGGSSYMNFDITTGANAGDISFYTAPSGVGGETTSIVSGVLYIITSAGGNFNTFGAADNNVGTEFEATSSGTASGGGVRQINYTTERMRIKENGVVQIHTGGVYQDHRATTNPAITKLRSNVTLTQGAAVDILNFRSLTNECSAVVYINYVIVQVVSNRSLVYGKVAFPIAKRQNADISIGSENNILSPTLYQYPGAGGMIGVPTLTWSSNIISGLPTDVEQVIALQLNFTDTNAVSNIAIAFDVELIDTYFDTTSTTTFGAVSMETV